MKYVIISLNINRVVIKLKYVITFGLGRCLGPSRPTAPCSPRCTPISSSRYCREGSFASFASEKHNFAVAFCQPPPWQSKKGSNHIEIVGINYKIKHECNEETRSIGSKTTYDGKDRLQSPNRLHRETTCLAIHWGPFKTLVLDYRVQRQRG